MQGRFYVEKIEIASYAEFWMILLSNVPSSLLMRHVIVTDGRNRPRYILALYKYVLGKN